MKKILCTIFAIFMVVALVGCANTNSSAYLAKKINKNTTKLLEAINNLEQIYESDVVIPEFSGNNSNFNQNSATNTNYKLNRLSKIKQLINKNNELVILDINNIKDYETPSPRFMDNRSIYEPRYVKNDDNNLENNHYNIFKNKIDNLYNVSSDCNYINSECNRIQEELKTAISECKTLCEKLQNGEIKLNDTQLSYCNTYANQINYCCKQIKNSKGSCQNYLQTLRSLKNYFGSNSDTLSTNYLNLLGCLETRLSNYKQALECVNNCINLLKSCYTPSENIIDNNLENNETLENKQNLEQPKQYINNNPVNQPIVNPPVNRPMPVPYNSNNGYYNAPYNSNNGYYNGYYNGYNPYNQTPNNVNTYGPINKNIDTYKSYNTLNNPNAFVNEENKTLIENDNNKNNVTIETKLENKTTKDLNKLSDFNNEIDNKNINEKVVKIENNKTKTNENEINTTNSLKEEKFVSSDIKTITDKPRIKHIEDNKENTPKTLEETENNKVLDEDKEQKQDEENKNDNNENDSNINENQNINNNKILTKDIKQDIKTIKHNVDDLNNKVENDNLKASI